MTLCEKILASHVVVDALGRRRCRRGQPGDAFFARADVRFSHEYVTPMAESLMVFGFGPGATVSEPETVYAFRDHLTFLDLIMPKAHRDMGLDVKRVSSRRYKTSSRSAPASSSTARFNATGGPPGRRASATTRSSKTSRCPGRSS